MNVPESTRIHFTFFCYLIIRLLMLRILVLHEGIDDVDSPCGSNQTPNVHPKPTHVEKHVVTFDVSVFVYFGNVCVGIFWLMSATMKKWKEKQRNLLGTGHYVASPSYRRIGKIFFPDTRCQFAFLPPHFPWRRSYQHVAMFHKMLPFLQHEPHQTISKHIMQGTQKWHQKDANGLKAVPGSKH